ncbi:hypothetical protein HWV62_3763 [Athelia sp. TMB]|nr:hypothetical protein HWV62_3763 [Athelia sp. TMB]
MASQPQELPSTTNEVLEECPRFRILLVGKSGTGKSSLIKHTFNVDLDTVSHESRGICDINDEITSPENTRFVLHDSMGYEGGETKNLNSVINFLQSRSKEVHVKDRVHAVWLCTETPFAGGRVFETGDEALFKLELSVPIIVVFTKFDYLVANEEMEILNEGPDIEDDAIEALAIERANALFKTLCTKQLEGLGHDISHTKVSVQDGYRDTLTELINITQTLLSNQGEEGVWMVAAMAQRASAQAKIDSSIKVGMKRYWQGIASSAHFNNQSLDTCLNTIHSEITSGWFFNDPDKLLDGQKFRERIKIFTQFVTPDAADLSSWFSQSIGSINNFVGIATAVASAVAPVTAVVGLSALFVQWIAKIYQRTPETLRCLMGHIIDLTLVMDLLFLQILPLKPPRRLTWEQIETALEEYSVSSLQQVHRQIREYASASSLPQIIRADNAQDKIIALIGQYRSK